MYIFSFKCPDQIDTFKKYCRALDDLEEEYCIEEQAIGEDGVKWVNIVVNGDDINRKIKDWLGSI
jgi:hypothetical protein